MGELNTKRKIRDNQVRAMGFIVSSNDALDEKDAREFLDRSVQWFGARYGYENLLAAQIHLDEGTPHAHFGFVPLKEGKLSWKGFFPDKAALGAMQDRFYGRVGALYGLSRGEKRLEGQPARRHSRLAVKAEGARVSAHADGRAASRLRRRSRGRSAKLVRTVRVDGSMEQSVTTGVESSANADLGTLVHGLRN